MTRKHTLTLLLSLAAANVASAAIVISSASPNLNASAGGVVPYTILRSTYSGFTAVGTGKLIVAFGSRATNSPTLTYGGVPLTQAVAVSNTTSNGGSGAIYYLDNPTVDGDLVFTVGSQNSYQINLYFVTGLALGGPAPPTTDFSPSSDPSLGITLSLTTGSSGGFVIASGGSNGTVTPTVTSGTYNTNFARVGNASWLDNSGSTTYSLTTNAVSAGVMAVFAPAAIPEPSSAVFAMMSACGLLFLRRRR